MWLGLTFNSWLQGCSTSPDLCGARDQTQGFTHSRQEFYQLSHTPSPLKPVLNVSNPPFSHWNCACRKVGPLGVDVALFIWGYQVTVMSFYQCQLLQAVTATPSFYLLSTFWEIGLTVHLSIARLSVQLANQTSWMIAFSDAKTQMQPPVSLSVYRTPSFNFEL